VAAAARFALSVGLRAVDGFAATSHFWWPPLRALRLASACAPLTASPPRRTSGGRRCALCA